MTDWDKAHLEMFRRGVDAWNAWRHLPANRYTLRPDLESADLRGSSLASVNLGYTNLLGSILYEVNLEGANLVGARLNATRLREANLRGADCANADFWGALLPGASLAGATLHRTNFESANLTGCDLTGCRLEGTIFSGTRMAEANFSGSTMSRVVFAGVDFRGVRGLEAVVHRGPSTIGLDSIVLSNGEIPEEFLRGVGLPDTVIAYARSLAARPIDFYSCFISYSTADVDLAKRLYADLQAAGVRCWFAPEDLKIGDKFRQQIDDSIRVFDKLLVVLSAHSIESDWVETEVEGAYELERRRGSTVLFPVRTDEAAMRSDKPWAGNIRRTRHIGDFTRWMDADEYSKSLERLLRDLQVAQE